MTYYTAIINMDTVKARCEVDLDDCWIWQGSQIQGVPYWATYDENGKRVNLHVGRLVCQMSGITVPARKKFIRICKKHDCVNPEHFHFPEKMGMFTQLLKPSERTSFW